MSNNLSRRKFLKVVAGSGIAGFGVMVTGCKGESPGGKGWIPDQYQGKGDFPVALKGRVSIAADNPSIERDDEKCILCGQCIEACEKVMGVYGNYPLPLKKEVPILPFYPSKIQRRESSVKYMICLWSLKITSWESRLLKLSIVCWVFPARRWRISRPSIRIHSL